MSHGGSTKYKECEGDSNLLPIVHGTSILTTRPYILGKCLADKQIGVGKEQKLLNA